MWMKNLIITCFFHVDEFLRLILLFLRNHFSGDDQYGRCVRGFWRQMPFRILLGSVENFGAYNGPLVNKMRNRVKT